LLQVLPRSGPLVGIEMAEAAGKTEADDRFLLLLLLPPPMVML
jgi:hypothetical protein